ncbi:MULTISPECIES: TetR/AcrR family transcriptional regulator [Actinomadura]|uniref:DNA-binding transcriptional regulator, AcrR family n=1 Tax=Actinomadura madurae TaxID=1993 RepID=A0A1I5WMA8_9ACTN|nr:TetR/AcrR family transcriptional regulator [Actinomadura madurae]SFQ20924.1 DNA-binding transcriptional regulator, AcrR family [Actinomadura madurae]SPT51803.1 HTH-type transcriptional repressor KstR2 [Actinomadura madurae]
MIRLDDASEQLWDAELGDVAKALLNSAVLCFSAKEFHATTTRDITAKIGISPGALYVHFESKEEVLYEILRMGHTRVLEDLRRLPAGEDARADLCRLVAAFVSWHARHHTVGRICQYELGPLGPEHYDKILALRGEINTIFRDAVHRHIEDARISDVPVSDGDVNKIARAILSLGVDLVRWYRLDGPDTPSELGEFYARLAIKMTEVAQAATPTR